MVAIVLLVVVVNIGDGDTSVVAGGGAWKLRSLMTVMMGTLEREKKLVGDGENFVLRKLMNDQNEKGR